MPRFSPREMAALRDAVFERANFRCQWPRCAHPQMDLQMSHFHHRGMGGSRAANTLDNLWALCSWHHDIFDGRAPMHHNELVYLAKAAVGM